MTSSKPAMLTLQEVAAHLRVSTRTVRRWLTSGDLAGHRFGRQWRIAFIDLEDFRRRHLSRSA
jgi:excisionase family DNA binding protein